MLSPIKSGVLVILFLVLFISPTVSNAEISPKPDKEKIKLLTKLISDLEQKLLKADKTIESAVRKEFIPYENSKTSVSLAVPEAQGWRSEAKPVGILFEKITESRDLYWTFRVKEASSFTVVLDEIKQNIHVNKDDKNVATKKIVIDGVAALHVLITSPSNPKLYGEYVIIDGKKSDHKGKFFVIFNGGVKDPDFKSFYESFRFGNTKTSSSAKSVKEKSERVVSPCREDALYSFSYYVAPNSDRVCYKKTPLIADAQTLQPLELVPQSIINEITPKNIHAKNFALDKNNFYINGKAVYTKKKKNYTLVSSPTIAKNGEVIISGKTYYISKTGLVGAALQKYVTK